MKQKNESITSFEALVQDRRQSRMTVIEQLSVLQRVHIPLNDCAGLRGVHISVRLQRQLQLSEALRKGQEERMDLSFAHVVRVEVSTSSPVRNSHLD